MTYMDMICDIARKTNPGDAYEEALINATFECFRSTPLAYIWADVWKERIKQGQMEGAPQ